MRLGFILSLSTACLFACSQAEDRAGDAAADGGVADATAPADSSGAPAAAPVQVAYAGHDYTCSDGLTFNARLDKGNALVTIDGKTVSLAPAFGALGAQYANEEIVFVALGNEAMLTRGSAAPLTCKAK